MNQVWTTGEATWSQNQFIPINPNNRLEDTYGTFSDSPVRIETGQIGGMLVVCTEITGSINALRQLKEHEE